MHNTLTVPGRSVLVFPFACRYAAGCRAAQMESQHMVSHLCRVDTRTHTYKHTNIHTHMCMDSVCNWIFGAFCYMYGIYYTVATFQQRYTHD